jgi:hypothetical protein
MWSAVEGAILQVPGSKGSKVRVTVVQECGEEFDPEEEVIINMYIYIHTDSIYVYIYTYNYILLYVHTHTHTYIYMSTYLHTYIYYIGHVSYNTICVFCEAKYSV